jgi:hypothetical protein
MDLDTLKQMRLTSKLWATLGESYLIGPDFIAFSYRRDFPRLRTICRHSFYSTCIHSLTFNLGDMNESNSRSGAYAPFICESDILSESFSSLPNLSSISISMANDTCTNEPVLAILRQTWAVPLERSLRRDEVCYRFGNVLKTLCPHVAKTKLRRLKHDCLPIEFFAQYQSRIEVTRPIFSQLTEIDLALNSGSFSHDQRFLGMLKSLGRTLRCAKGLERLSLTWLVWRRVDLSELFMELLPQEDSEEKTYFPKLEFLHLEALKIHLEPLVQFILGLKESLKVLELGGEVSHTRRWPNGGIHLLTGGYKDLFERVREGMANAERGNGLERFMVKDNLIDTGTDKDGVGGFGRLVAWT